MTSYQNFKVKKIKTDQIHLTKATVSSSHVGIATNDDIVVMGREQHSITGDSVKPFIQLDVPVRINNGAIFDLENENSLDPAGKFPGCVLFENMTNDAGTALVWTGPDGLLFVDVSGKIHKENIVPIEEEDIEWEELTPKRFNYKGQTKTYLSLVADDIFEITGIEDTIIRNKEGQISNFNDRALIALMVRELGRLQTRTSNLEGL